LASPDHAAARDALRGPALLTFADETPKKIIDVTALSLVSLHSLLIRKKGRKEGRPMAANLAVGSKAPSFKLPRDGGRHVSIADFKGRKLVIFFYPKADTPGCPRESMEFSRLRPQFQKARTDLLGVSADSVPAQDRFKSKHGLDLALASDETHEMLAAYGVWGEKSMYGKTYMGITRTALLVGENGRIARIWHKVKVDGHAAEVLAAAQAIT
jgi:thioredoxin-dependent peroxiredoxin